MDRAIIVPHLLSCQSFLLCATAAVMSKLFGMYRNCCDVKAFCYVPQLLVSLRRQFVPQSAWSISRVITIFFQLSQALLKINYPAQSNPVVCFDVSGYFLEITFFGLKPFFFPDPMVTKAGEKIFLLP
jgi:hypothetical protein